VIHILQEEMHPKNRIIKQNVFVRRSIGYPSGFDGGSLMAPIAEDQWIESHHLGKVSQKLLLVFNDAQLIFISFSTSRGILKDCEECQSEE